MRSLLDRARTVAEPILAQWDKEESDAIITGINRMAFARLLNGVQTEGAEADVSRATE
jgi:hypothetical protein